MHTQTNPTDCSYFDPVLTSLPPTLSELVTDNASSPIEGFNYGGSIEEIVTIEEPNIVTLSAEVH